MDNSIAKRCHEFRVADVTIPMLAKDFMKEVMSRLEAATVEDRGRTVPAVVKAMICFRKNNEEKQQDVHYILVRTAKTIKSVKVMAWFSDLYQTVDPENPRLVSVGPATNDFERDVKHVSRHCGFPAILFNVPVSILNELFSIDLVSRTFL
jgi:hypothetical protein